METIITATATALISAVIAAIVGAVVSRIKTSRKVAENARAAVEEERRKMQEAIDEMRKMQRDNTRMVCRLVIYSDKFSLDEKIEAYITYRDTCHANHHTKTYMDEQVGGDIDEYIKKHMGL